MSPRVEKATVRVLESLLSDCSLEIAVVRLRQIFVDDPLTAEEQGEMKAFLRLPFSEKRRIVNEIKTRQQAVN